MEEFASNVTVPQKLPVDNKLLIYEALSILDRKPDLIKQIDNYINAWKLFSIGINIPLTRVRAFENINSLSNNILDNYYLYYIIH